MQGLNFLGKIVLPLIFITAVLNCCKAKKYIYKSPPHYDFSKYFEDKLDLKIQEISGIVWDSRKDEFITHNDESGKIFYLDKESKLIKREFHFAGKGDYEDIAIVNGVPYILKSDGEITKIIADSTGKQFGVEAGKIPLSGANDFESMYYDSSRSALIVLCKNCKIDDKKTISAFAFYPDSIGFVDKPVFTIDLAKVAELSPRATTRLEPSAAAVHPKLHKVFIVSSGSNQLLITDLDGNPEAVFMLAKKLFPQPEGITFKNNGDMYISNEGVTGKGNLLRFIYTP